MRYKFYYMWCVFNQEWNRAYFLSISYNTLAYFLHQIYFSHAMACSLYNVMLFESLFCYSVKLFILWFFYKLKCFIFFCINCNLPLPSFNVRFFVFFYPLTTTLSAYYCTSLEQLLVNMNKQNQYTYILK